MQKYTVLKAACYTSSITMSVVGNLSPILFITFNTLYGISYSLLGLLVLINFITQLGIDLIFSFFSHKFNIPRTVKLIPIIAIIGLLIYGISPLCFKGYEYLGLSVGTVIFSAAAGLGEVLISPVIATIPAKDPDREMSKLHSVYAWGVVGVVIFATLFLFCFGKEKWYLLPLIFIVIPLVSAFLYANTKIPPIESPEKASVALSFFKDKTLWLCFFAIFFGGAAELTMAQWCSGYLEKSLGISKVWGDIFGVALFGLMLAIGRTLYAKKGKNIEKVLILGFGGAMLCYIIAAITNISLIGLFACAFTGFCVSMLWPGNLVVAAKHFEQSGVFIYALMAAGGDLGASVGPQLVGLVTDFTINNPTLLQFSKTLSLASEQLGLKFGILVAALFPLLGLLISLKLKNHED
ncbi:MAG: MFS transporter [Ruminococcaceae bacterium]|nr:MFS transporter [Oscillospiraceae bacterium]